MVVHFTAYDRSLASLEAALQPPPRNDRERDGAIQRFEYSFETVWKTAKRVLQDSGVTSTSPRDVIRDCAAQTWIEDADLWFQFLAMRNRTSHAYDAKTAEEVFNGLAGFLEEAKKLGVKLKSVCRS